MLEPPVTITCDFGLALVTFEQFCLSNFGHKLWVNMWYGFQVHPNTVVQWDHLLRLTLSRSHLFGNLTIMRLKPGPHDHNHTAMDLL